MLKLLLVLLMFGWEGWCSPYTNIRREAALPPQSPQGPQQDQLYSTLPDYLVNPSASNNNYQQQQQQSFQFDSQVNNPNNAPLIPGGSETQNFQFQQVGQQQPQFGPFVNSQPDFGGGGFDGSSNDLQPFPQEEESPGILSTLMTTVLETTGLSNLWNRMNDMITTFLPTPMSRIMMGAMALPLMIPMAAVPVGLGAMALASFPILQLTLPGIRRSLSEGATLTKDVLGSEQCLERITCNLAKKWGTGSAFSRWEDSEPFNSPLLHRMSKSFKIGRDKEDCKQFQCSPVTKVQNMVRHYVFGGKEGENENDKKPY